MEAAIFNCQFDQMQAAIFNCQCEQIQNYESGCKPFMRLTDAGGAGMSAWDHCRLHQVLRAISQRPSRLS